MKTLIQSIFYREWLKTRLVVLLSLLVILAVMMYILLDIAQSIRINGVANFVRDIIINNTQPLIAFKYLPAILGLTLAVSQFTPEMIDRRFRLTLHLPYKEHYIMAALLAYGTLTLFAMYSISMWCTLLLSNSIPMIVLNHIALSVYPWLISGLITYALTIALIIEPYWLRKISFVPLLLSFDFVMLIDCEPMAFINSGAFFVFATIVSYMTPFYNMIRFKNGQAI